MYNMSAKRVKKRRIGRAGRFGMSKIRLDRMIASQGRYTRKEAAALIKSGAVSVRGSAVRDGSVKVDTDADEVTVRGEPFVYSEHVYIMMNKPEGVVSASESPGDRTVIDLVPEELRRRGLFPAGRLDKDTTGFVLITDDGDFAHRILSPSSHVEKTYIAALAEPIPEEKLAAFESGLTLADGYVCLPAGIKPVGPDGLTVEIKLREGKYHQIKRMVAACGSRVTALERTRIGGVGLDPGLDPGECRLMTREEMKAIENR